MRTRTIEDRKSQKKERKILIKNIRFLRKKLERDRKSKGRNGRSWLRSGIAGIREKYSIKGTQVVGLGTRKIGDKKSHKWESKILPQEYGHVG